MTAGGFAGSDLLRRWAGRPTQQPARPRAASYPPEQALSSTRRRAFTRLIAAHKLISVMVAVGAVLRILAMVAYWPALLFYGDSYGYLRSASTLRPDMWHPMGYPFVLRVLSITSWLPVVPLLQHLVGLGLGVAIYAFVWRRGGRRWLAALAAAPILLDAYQINIEQFVLTELMVETLLVFAFGLLLWRDRPSKRALVGVGLLLAVAAITRTVAIALLPLCIGYVLLRGFGWRRALASAALLLIAFAVPIIGYASWNRQVTGTFGLASGSGMFLYANTAAIADCSAFYVPDYERVLCEKAPGRKQGPNYYAWDIRSPRLQLDPPPGMTPDQVMSDFAKRVIIHQPFDFTRQGLGEIVHYFAPWRYQEFTDWYMGTWKFPGHTPGDPRWHVYYATVGFDNATVVPSTVPALQTLLRGYQTVVWTPGPLLAAGILLPLGALVRRRGSRRIRLDGLLLAASGLMLLVIPSYTACFDYRYALPTLPLLVPAAALGLLAFRPAWAHRSPPPARPAG